MRRFPEPEITALSLLFGIDTYRTVLFPGEHFPNVVPTDGPTCPAFQMPGA